MRITKYGWAGIISGALALAGTAITIYRVHCQCHCYDQESYAKHWGWTCRAIGDPTAMFTLFGTLALVVGFLFISGQMQQADVANDLTSKALDVAIEANKQTARSVDAYINSERGVVAFSSYGISDTDYIVDPVLKNAGKGLATVTEWKVIPEVIPRKTRIDRKLFGNFEHIRWPLEASDKVTYAGVVGPAPIISDPEKATLKTTHVLVVHQHVRFTTQLGDEFVMRMVAVKDFVNGAFEIQKEQRLTFREHIKKA